MNQFVIPNSRFTCRPLPSPPLDVHYYFFGVVVGLSSFTVTERLVNVNSKKVRRSKPLPVRSEKLLHSHILVRVPVFVDLISFSFFLFRFEFSRCVAVNLVFVYVSE